MNEELAVGGTILATTPEALKKIALVEEKVRTMPQLHIRTEHILHGGMYTRTVRLAAGVLITSALIKVPTMVIVNGTCRVFSGDSEWLELEGFNVIPANAGRKMVYVTASPTQITMLFPSRAKSVEEAEGEFTEEAETLLSRQCLDDLVLVTGVEPCQV
jgi:tetrahydromethanopterin S-methyltransferase subunit F